MPYDVDLLRAAVSIADVLLEAGIEVHGRRMRCPLHGGGNPTAFSFDDTHFRCFACGARGDVFDLARALHGLQFRDAVAHVARLAGVAGTLPRLDRATIHRRTTVARRRATLRAWREQRWTESVVEAERLDRLARQLGQRLTCARTGGEAAMEARYWDLLARVRHARDDADWLAVRLGVPSEQEWLRLWRGEMSMR